MAVVRQQPNVWGQVAPAAAGFLGKLTGAYQRSAALKELDAYTRSAGAHEAEPMAFASTVIEIAQKYGMTPGPVVQQLLAIKEKDWEAKGASSFAEQLLPKPPTAEFARASEEAGFTPTGAEGPPTQEATSPWAAAARTGRLTIPQIVGLWQEDQQAKRMARDDARLERRDRDARQMAWRSEERLSAKDLWDRQKEQEKAAREEQERRASAEMFRAMSKDAISPEQFVTSAAQPFTPLDTVRAQGEAFQQATDDLAGTGDAAYEAISVSGKPAYDAAKALLDERRTQAKDAQALRRERERENAPKWSESRGAFVAPGRAAEVPEGLPEKEPAGYLPAPRGGGESDPYIEEMDPVTQRWVRRPNPAYVPPDRRKTGGAGPDAAGLTPEAQEMLAQAATLGIAIPMAPFGMGSGGTRTAVYNKMAEFLNKNNLPVTALGDNKALRSAFGSSLNNQVKVRDMMAGFVRNMGEQIDRVTGLTNDIKRFDTRILNVPLVQAKQKIKGDPNEAILNMYLTEISNEIAKLSTGSSASISELSIEAQKKWDRIHDRTLSVGALLKLLNETKNAGQMRLRSVDKEINDTRGRISSIGSGRDPYDASAPSAAATPTPTPTTQAPRRRAWTDLTIKELGDLALRQDATGKAAYAELTRRKRDGQTTDVPRRAPTPAQPGNYSHLWGD